VQIIDEKYRLFGVINLIDLAVVLAVLVGGFAVYRVLAPSAVPIDGSSKTKTIEYVFLCPNVREWSPSQVIVGDPLYKTSGKLIGKVTAVRATPTPGDAWDVTGRKITRFTSSIGTDVYITVVGQGQPTSTGVAAADALLHSNQLMPIMTSTFQSELATIVSMKIAGE
jgi:hypothetical protein